MLVLNTLNKFDKFDKFTISSNIHKEICNYFIKIEGGTL